MSNAHWIVENLFRTTNRWDRWRVKSVLWRSRTTFPLNRLSVFCLPSEDEPAGKFPATTPRTVFPLADKETVELPVDWEVWRLCAEFKMKSKPKSEILLFSLNFWIFYEPRGSFDIKFCRKLWNWFSSFVAPSKLWSHRKCNRSEWSCRMKILVANFIQNFVLLSTFLKVSWWTISSRENPRRFFAWTLKAAWNHVWSWKTEMWIDQHIPDLQKILLFDQISYKATEWSRTI